MENKNPMPKIYLQHYGCSSNTADAEIMRGLLQESGFQLVENPQESDVNLVLTCVVKTPTEVKVSKRLKELEALGTPLIVAGCMPESMAERVRSLVPQASLLGPDHVEEVAKVAWGALRGQRMEALGRAPTDKTCLPRARLNPLVHVAPISSGCLGNCAYCIVKLARGSIQSYPWEGVVEDVERAVAEGCREVWVTAEDTAAYRAGGVNLAGLLERIAGVPGEFRVRVGMCNPNTLSPILEEFIEALSSPKIYKFVHIPVQSGNNQVLKAMNRGYTVEDFKAIVERLREAYPEVGLSTDIICGFPGETWEMFQDSLRLVEWLRPDVLNISRYWERPGTPAIRLPGKVHGRETKRRSRVLTQLWRRLGVEAGRRWLGWEGEVLVTERSRRGGVVGRNYAYKTVVLDAEVPLGTFTRVRVVGEPGVGYVRGVPV